MESPSQVIKPLTQEIEHDSILAAYTLKAVARASEDDFDKETSHYVALLSQGEIPIMEDKTRGEAVAAIASASVLCQIVRDYMKQRPISLIDNVPQEASIFTNAQATIRQVGLKLVKSELDPTVMMQTSLRCNGRGKPLTPNIEAAAEVWWQRGKAPYYDGFYKVEHGTQWLESLLEDLVVVHAAIN